MRCHLRDFGHCHIKPEVKRWCHKPVKPRRGVIRASSIRLQKPPLRGLPQRSFRLQRPFYALCKGGKLGHRRAKCQIGIRTRRQSIHTQGHVIGTITVHIDTPANSVLGRRRFEHDAPFILRQHSCDIAQHNVGVHTAGRRRQLCRADKEHRSIVQFQTAQESAVYVADCREPKVGPSRQKGICLGDTCFDIISSPLHFEIKGSAQRGHSAAQRQRRCSVQLTSRKRGKAADVCRSKGGIQCRLKPVANAIKCNIALEAVITSLQIKIADAERLAFNKVDFGRAADLLTHSFGQCSIDKSQAVSRKLDGATELAHVSLGTCNSTCRAQSGLGYRRSIGC